MIQNLIDIFTAPSAALTRLKEKPTVLAPLLLVTLAVCSVQAGYFLTTDPGFVADQMIDRLQDQNPNIPDEQLAALRQGFENPMLLAGAAFAQYFIGLVVLMALYAVYLNFASKFAFVQFGFKPWFSLVNWTRMPIVFTALASWVAILTNTNGQLPIDATNPLSFRYLLGVGASSGPLTVLTPLHLWWLALLAMGYQQWTGKSILASFFIIVIPFALFFGAWGLFTGF